MELQKALKNFGLNIVSRLAGSKMAAATTAAGSAAGVSTAVFDPGYHAFPENPTYALIINILNYVVSALLIWYREKQSDE